MSSHAVYPLGNKAKILLSSVFGPYAQDDEYGSRKINPMELYHNQVTRVQGVFSLRMFHRSFGLLMIQANLDAPCTLLDFPTLERFVEELRENSYDIVGISSIAPNIGKVKKMCELIRKHLPQATIVVGGHIANKGGLEKIIDADHIVKGEGVRWFRSFLGLDQDASIRHPEVYSANGTRILGHTLPVRPGETAAMLVPSVGCPLGCNFCCTSALFGGKGKSINFYETGDELFEVMCGLEKKLFVKSFFVMDENFLYHRKRALRLLELMKENNKSWALNVFSSARVIESYSIEELVGLGIGWVWMGIEGRESQYRKLASIDTRKLVQKLQSHGIRVLGSSIIGLENHTPENIDEVINYAVSHDTVFHQFMLYTPLPGTPLYEEHKKDGTLYDESAFSIADTHGQYRFNYRHKHIRDGQEEEFLLDAFRRDLKINGPSVARLARTLLKGWLRYKNYPDRRIRDRFAWEAKSLKDGYAGAIWAMAKGCRKDRPMAKKLELILRDIYREFGLKTRIIAPVIGIFLFLTMKLEERRLARGWTYEPRSFYEKNQAALALERAEAPARQNRTYQGSWGANAPSPAGSRR